MRRRSFAIAFAGSTVAVAVASLAVLALRPIAPTLSLGVLYTLAVLATAVLFGAAFAVGVAIASMLAFNFFFLAPVHTLTLADGRNWAALGVYLVTAIVASDLATRARRRAAEAEQREREAAFLSDAAAALLQVGNRDALVAEVRERAALVTANADAAARVRIGAAVDSLLGVADERERLESEAREAEALRRSDAIKTTILQAVSHDFRTPLATMSAAVGGLTNGELDLSPADRDELLDTVRLELGRLTRLVENLLDLSRLQAGAAVPHFELWEVDELLARALADAPDSERVVCEVASAVPAALVDAGQVQRILANLIENALKFSPAEEPVEVRAWEHGDDVAIEVLDRGVGLDADEVSKLLEPFARGREVVRAPGAGLGLAIARGFADVNGGGLSLTPRIGGGTCARLVLRGRRLPAGIVSR